jgi:hypothetical protein
MVCVVRGCTLSHPLVSDISTTPVSTTLLVPLGPILHLGIPLAYPAYRRFWAVCLCRIAQRDLFDCVFASTCHLGTRPLDASTLATQPILSCQGNTGTLAACSILFSRLSLCAHLVVETVIARANHHDHQDRGGYRQVTRASNAEDARFGAMVYSHVASASGTSTQRHAVTQNLHNELCLAESEQTRTSTRHVILIE